MSVEKIVTGTLAERDAKINANFEALDTGKLGKTETAADSSKLGGVAASSYAKTADMNSAIEAAKSAVKDELIDGAPDTYDTLKEIADYIAEDKTGAAAMNEAIAGKLGKTETAVAAAKLTTSAGSTTQPVYFDGGVPKACTYSLNKTVPADAVFTDTTYTAGTGISISSNAINNTGVRSVTAGSTANQLSVNTGGTTTTITINNVANATSATKATQDASGNVITSTYATKDEVTEAVTGAASVTKTEFTASSANWGTLSNGYYPFTLAASGKHFLGMYRTNGSTYESVMVDVVESGSNIIIQSTEKFAGFVLTI
jgi:hypothetical protein|nr:MAG TPA: hypothetical protein [Caudoviricetes sp.]